MSNRLRIQNTILELIQEGEFYPVTYINNGYSTAPSREIANLIRPTSVECNETGSAFEPDPLNGRRLVQQRSSWFFEAKAQFNKEVLMEYFEEKCNNNVIVIPAQKPLRAVFIRLTASEYAHPPRHSANNGSAVIFRFECQESRA